MLLTDITELALIIILFMACIAIILIIIKMIINRVNGKDETDGLL